jgi:hypothetical protein
MFNLTKKTTTRYMTPERLDDDDMVTALCMPGTKPLVVQAVLQVLRDHIDDAVELVGSIKTATEHGQLAHCAGALDALRALESDLMIRIDEASRVG